MAWIIQQFKLRSFKLLYFTVATIFQSWIKVFAPNFLHWFFYVWTIRQMLQSSSAQLLLGLGTERTKVWPEEQTATGHSPISVRSLVIRASWSCKQSTPGLGAKMGLPSSSEWHECVSWTSNMAATFFCNQARQKGDLKNFEWKPLLMEGSELFRGHMPVESWDFHNLV